MVALASATITSNLVLASVAWAYTGVARPHAIAAANSAAAQKARKVMPVISRNDEGNSLNPS
jgi:hypothetical protein